MHASIVTDQISADINTALELMLECSCREFELREIGLAGALDADERWLELAEKAVTVKRFRVTQIATDFFLKPFAEGIPDEAREERLFALAKRLKCGRVSVFGCHSKDGSDVADEETGMTLPSEEALDALSGFIERAEAQKIEVVLRTHHDSCAGTADEALALIKEIDAPNLGLDWDVGECMAAGDGTGLDAIEEILPVLKSVHFRDAVRRGMSAEWASVGKGVIPWQDIIEQLHTGGFRGPIIADPSVAPKLKESRNALVLLTRWIDAARLRRKGTFES